MGNDTYSLTPLNLALDGTLDSFVEAYWSIYEVYLRKVRETPTLINIKSNLDSAVIPEILPILDFLVFKRLRIFTTKINRLSLHANHLKRFSFFNETRVEDFKWKKQYNLEWKNKGLASFVDERYLEAGNDEFEFQETAITLEHFLKEVQRIVIRAIHEEVKKDNPGYTIFDARAAVEARVAERMKKQREGCILPKNDDTLPNSEPLYVYDRLSSIGCKQDAHKLIIKKYYAIHMDGTHILAIPTHYCEDCNRYLIGSLSLSLFKEFAGEFIAQTYRTKSGFEDIWSFLGESKLHNLGYNVVDGKLSASERKNLLIGILEGKQLSFFEIVATIERNIHVFSSNPRMNKAVEKWRSDLQFINAYALNKKN